MKKIRWGIVSTAKIAREKVIPAMQRGTYSEVTAIASRNQAQAEAVAGRLHINKVFGSYEAMLNDPDIDALYIPLPNDLHVEWAIKGLQAGKHILCEKPIALSSAEAKKLLNASKEYPRLKIMEAFMYRFHPQWVHAKKLVQEGQIGELITIQSFFSYYNIDPDNIRNKKQTGGGGMMDIGCYCVSLSRFVFDKEPVKVFGAVEYDPVMGTDRIASAILDFGSGTASFTCSTQLIPYQRVNIFGTEARIEIEIPFNALPDKEMNIWLHAKGGSEVIRFDAVDQYTIQADLFSQAILEDLPVPTGLEDAVNNMTAIEEIIESAAEGRWRKML